MAEYIRNEKDEGRLVRIEQAVEPLGYDHFHPKTGLGEYYALFQAYRSMGKD